MAYVHSRTMVARPEEEGEWQYFSSSKKIGWKTGTSYGNRDAWAVGATPTMPSASGWATVRAKAVPLMTGVGYAAPLLFDVFGLLPAGSGSRSLTAIWKRPSSAGRAAVWLRTYVPTAIR